MVLQRTSYSRNMYSHCLVIAVLAIYGTLAQERVQTFEIYENEPEGTLVGNIGQGLDPTYGPPYTLLENSSPSQIHLNTDTGEIRTKLSLDREINSKHTITVYNQNLKSIRATINVLDRNDQSPQFNVTQKISISESSNIGSSIHIGSAIDNDSGENGIKKNGYSIVSGNDDGIFSLKGTMNGPMLYLDLEVKGMLDYETIKSYMLVIRIKDGGDPPRQTDFNLEIDILDANDNTPKFELSKYDAVVNESAAVGTSVLRVSATDEDTGDNKRITYSLDYKNDQQQHFRVDPVTGIIYVDKPLDYEDTQTFQITVKATDGGDQPSLDTAVVQITVRNNNERPASINLQYLINGSKSDHIPENTQVGSWIARISVSDPDTPNIYYSNINVTLQGAGNYFDLVTSDRVIFKIRLKKPLDREATPSITFTILAVDSGSPPLQSSKVVTLHLDDVNDNSPIFDKQLYEASVQEQAQPGSFVVRVHASDKDTGNNAKITYAIQSHPLNNSNWFQIDPELGSITVQGQNNIDCEENHNPWITVTARDSGNPSRTGSTVVSISVLDVNDMQPQFAQTFYPRTVPENVQVGSCILTVSAEDQDCNGNTQLTYKLSNFTLASMDKFSLHPKSGKLCVVKELDYETEHTYEFPVYAVDNGGLSGNSMITVTVTDVNDNHPQFDPRNYSQNIDQNEATAGRDIITVQATDRDHGRFGEITYRIISGDYDGKFSINSKTGLISLSQNLPVEEKVYLITVEAVDKGGLKSREQATVYISVTGSDYPRPTFQKATYSFAISEDKPRRTKVGQVKAVIANGNSNQVIRYSITSGDLNGNFYIDQLNGWIFTNRSLDREQKAFVLLNVMAESDSPPVFGKAQVNVSVSDVNDNAPRFIIPEVRIHVFEDEDTATTVYSAIATDNDHGINGTVRYSLKENLHDTFEIDAITGEIRLVKALDYEDVKEYRIVIVASDLGDPVSLTSNMTLIVSITNRNDNPPIFSNDTYRVNVNENKDAGSNILQIHASDKDLDQITFTLQQDSNYDFIFGIYPNTGYLYLKKKLDRETQSMYLLTVTAKDNGKPKQLSVEAKIQINVTDYNDNNPVFSENIYYFQISENVPVRTTVGYVSASDLDIGPNANLKYEFLSNQHPFILNPFTGEIISDKTLDRETKEKYELVVKVKDQGVPSRSDTAQVIIMVLDENDNKPQFMNLEPIIGTVKENQPKGTRVIQMLTYDIDEEENSTISFHFIVNGVNQVSTGQFDIDPRIGWISTSEVLDYEDTNKYKLTVVAKDHGIPAQSTQVEVMISVIDSVEKEIFPDIVHTVDITENIPVGSKVTTVKLDGASKVFYYEFAGNVFESFIVNRTTGDVYCVKNVDYEVASAHRLGVHAVDESSDYPKTSTIQLDIRVSDLNDNTPEFEQDPYIIRKPENLPIGRVVHVFSATDRDSGLNGTIKYRLFDIHPTGDYFSINEDTGSLEVKSLIDYEKVKEISLIVEAEDQSSNVAARRKSTVNVRYIVEDVNDNYPEFNTYARFSVLEDRPVGYVITQVVAVDADSTANNSGNGQVTYQIVGGNEGNKFHLDSNTGLLSVHQSVDRELKSLYSLNVSASDHGMPPRVSFTTLSIQIEDVNDNSPRFSKSVYTGRVTENNSPNHYVLSVLATDDDEGKNQELTYILPSGGADGAFSLNPTTGALSVSRILDREHKGVYEFTVYATDKGQPTLFDKATVIVYVDDQNDNSPRFQTSPVELLIPENQAQTGVYTVLAADPDQGDNGKVIYSIAGGNSQNDFTIDSVTGQLSCKALDREKTANYSLTITARDQNSMSRMAQMTINIKVVDINDNKPVFIHDTFTKRIREDEEIGAMVLLVSASDADEGENGRITYSLGNDTDGMFRVDSVTGNITTTGKFDKERKSSYKFHLVAEDNGAYNRGKTTATIEVGLINVNDNAPVFQNVPYTKSLAQNTGGDQFVLRVQATDLDNAKLHYSLGGTTQQKALQYFRIDNDSGHIYTSRVLTTDALGYHYLHVIANDLGTPAKSTTGVVQIKVGSGDNFPNIQFSETVYKPSIFENADAGTLVTTVTASLVNTNSAPITYSFLEGNDNIFSINGNGQITVRSKNSLDHEKNEVIKLIVSATTGQYYGYAIVEVTVKDVNDNPPIFAQNPYYASINEDINIGTTVAQVLATDADSGSNGALRYHILKPDQDQSFDINQEGYITTRLPLDFEIRTSYSIEIEAVDQSTDSSKTGTCVIQISVVDVNDQQPNFPSNLQPKNISEALAVGSLVTRVTANDVDKYPPLLYDFDADGNPDNRFAIDKFSGNIYLAKPIDHEDWNHFTIGLRVTDQNNVAETKLDIYIDDMNDNAPVFKASSYQGSVNEKTASGVSVLTVSAKDKDSGVNAKIVYSIETSSATGFVVHPQSGVISTATKVVYVPDHTTVQLSVKATDHGSPALSSLVMVYIQIVPVNQNAPRFTDSSYGINIPEDQRKGVSITRVQATDDDANHQIDYIIKSGNQDQAFFIGHQSGDLYSNNPLDRERVPEYKLEIVAQDRVNPIMTSDPVEVTVTVQDVNDNYPQFPKSEYSISLREDYPYSRSFMQILATDNDAGANSKLMYSISSGDDEDLFTIGSLDGVLKVKHGKHLDYETKSSHRLTIKATDCVGCLLGARKLSGITLLIVHVIDINDHVPFFPVPSYFTIFNEGQSIDSRVLLVKAEDSDSGVNGQLVYTIEDTDHFRIDKTTGQLYSKTVFDAENLVDLPSGQNTYTFKVTAQDNENQTSTVSVMVQVGDVDEHVPKFSETSYDFKVPGNAKKGAVVGQIMATDTDGGAAGKVYYFLTHPNDYLDINVSTGVVYVKLEFNSDPPSRRRRDTKFDFTEHSRNKRSLSSGSINLVIEARSAVENPKRQTTVVEISVDQSCEGCQLGATKLGEQSGGFEGPTMIVVIVLAVLLVITIIIVGIVVFRYRKNKKAPTTVAHVYEGDFSSTFDFSQPPGNPPNYNDVPNYNRSNSHNVTTSSDVSEQSHHSVSSGRGSVEAEDDEEICMINSLSNDLNQSSGFRSKNMPDSGIQEDDTTSEPSVQNSKDYLARLGIDSSTIPVTKSKNMPIAENDGLPPYSEVAHSGNIDLTDDPLDFSNLDYGKLATDSQLSHQPAHSGHHQSMNQQKDLGFHEPEPQHQGALSHVINSEEEYSGSYNWDYLLDWGPQYQPLAHVFSEIARLKDDNVQPKKRPIQTVPQNNINSALKTQGTKMFPPPIITNAPPAAVQTGSSGRSSQSSSSSSSIKMPKGKKNVSHSSSMVRSPITNDASYTTPLTPSFTPSLSPLGTNGPSMTPMSGNMGSQHSNMGQQHSNMGQQHSNMGQQHSNMGPQHGHMVQNHHTPSRGRLGSGVVLYPPQEAEQELRI